MSLSDEEQRLLAQLEASLAADDPQLARTMRGTVPRQIRRHVALASVLVFLLGLAALVAGVEIHPLLGVLGYVLMVGALVKGRESVQATPSSEGLRVEQATRPRRTREDLR